MTVDTIGSQVLFGQSNSLTGKLVVRNASNTNTVTIQSGVTSSSYILTLPTAVGATGECLKATNGTGTLGFGSCGSSGGTRTITLAPEFPGAVFTPDGSNNVGFMQSDRVGGLSGGQGYKHNFYQWSTDQVAAQDYDISTSYQIPSDFSGFASGSWKIWVYADSLTSTNIEFMIKSSTDASCYASAQSVKPVGAGAWEQITIANPGNGCTFAANDIITITVTPRAITPATNYVKFGELQFSYN